MDLWATKTTPECEDIEAERLVRPDPKVKPPRRDRRRERVDIDYDPDTDDKDPDESRNYKDIGGSIGGLVVRYLEAKNKNKLITVRKKDTDKVVQVSEGTLREEGGKYEKLKKAPKKEKAPKSKKDPEEEKPKKLDESQDEKDDAALTKEIVKKWLGKGRHKRPEFNRFLESVPTSTTDDVTGEVLVLNPKTKKRVPFNKLPPEAQRNLIESYSEHKSAEGLSKSEAKKRRQDQIHASRVFSELPPKVRASLEQLADPNSTVSQEVARLAENHDLADIHPSRVLSELKGVGLPKELTSIAQAREFAVAARTYDALPEGEKAGIKEPVRREVSDLERDQADSLLARTLPPEIAADYITANLHPDDVRALVHSYLNTKRAPVKDISTFAKGVSKVYETDPSRVKPPKTWERGGKEVPFEDLTPEEKASAYRQHQLEIVAVSLAAKEQLGEALQMKGRVPPEMAHTLASAMLVPESKETTDRMASLSYEAVLKSGTPFSVTDKDCGRLLGKLKGTPAYEVAQAMFLASDYHKGKKVLLEKFSERSSAKDIIKGLRSADEFFKSRGNLYGVKDISKAPGGNPLVVFRQRLLDRLSSLVPDKAVEVQSYMDRIESEEYDQSFKKWKSAHQEWLERKKDHEEKQVPGGPYRSQPEPFEEPEPEEPVKPIRYGLHKGLGEKDGHKSRQRTLSRAGVSKIAFRIAHRFVSTYAQCRAMGYRDRTSVYHGVEPYTDTQPYSEWEQAHQRDLGEGDYTEILKSAQKWLKTPVLSKHIEGCLPDQPFRAALDLAIQTSRYNGGINATTYNELLARFMKGAKREGSICKTIAREHGENISEKFMTTKLSAAQSKKASEILNRMDALASEIQQKYASWGMSFDDARETVNCLDQAADTFEKGAFGKSSFQTRQMEVMAAVVQRDNDELYVDNFQNPHQPVQTDADEPYMSAYADDQSSAVYVGKASDGRPLAP